MFEIVIIIVFMLQLFNQFSEPYNLWEAQLAILQFSNHDDRELVNQIWENILLKGENYYIVCV